MRTLVALTGLLLVAACGGPTVEAANEVPLQAPPPPLTVVEVTDADTFKLSDGSTVRVLGIDAPERGACGFEEANAFARVQVLNKVVEVSADPTQDDVDRWGRALRYVNVGPVDASVAITRAGWAKNYVYNNVPVQRAPAIQGAEAVARNGRLGIWGDLCAPAPPPVTTTPPPPPAAAVVENDEPDRDVDRPRQPAPAPEPKPPAAPRGVHYENCAAARAAGDAPLHRGDPGYRAGLDRDDDGIACE